MHWMRFAKNLPPGYFTLVMATGVVALACHRWDWNSLAWGLTVFNLGAFAVLCLLTMLRSCFCFPSLIHDLSQHATGPGFFTAVAGSAVLGSQMGMVLQDWVGAAVLWFVSLLLWLVLCCTFFPLVAVKEQKPDLAHEVNSLWLVVVVATQSLSVLAGMLAGHAVWMEPAAWLWLATGFHLLGILLYMLIMPSVFQRVFFEPLSLRDVDPPYWINMGVEATTTLAGVQLVRHASHFGWLHDMSGALKLATLAFWTLSGWWLPILLALGFWRHVLARLPIRYQPGYWGLVYPLGMYSLGTLALSQEFALPILRHLSVGVLLVALLAWGLTFIGLSHQGWRLAVKQPRR
ncbi:tellurite resistance/C4-dicarboxylate transporter family protein [Marinobacteraceae bacterium S3BR75-40.1]